MSDIADTPSPHDPAAANASPGVRPEGVAPAGRPPRTDKRRRGPAPAQRGTPVHPALEQLATLYPALFGAVFRPLKRGIFQELLTAHPEALEREALKAALALHTRSTRYLLAVASGMARHDLAGQPVEAMAPEHVHHALMEVFRRRLGRTPPDQQAALRARVVQDLVRAFEASGLSREAYGELLRGKDETANALLDEALAEAGARHARAEALRRAFTLSGQDIAAFASMYGLDPRDVARTLGRAEAAPATPGITG